MEPITMPPFWEPLIKRYLKRTFYQGTRKKDFALREEFTEGDYRFFAEGVKELNKSFTEERAFLPANYFNRKEARSGYIFYFLPINALKVAALLSQASYPLLTPLKILDIGSGPGTGMFGVFLWLEKFLKEGAQQAAPLSIEWTLLDQNREALENATAFHAKIVEHLQKNYPHCTIKSSLKTRFLNLRDRVGNFSFPKDQDLIFCLNVLSEISRHKRASWVEAILRQSLQPHGKMLIMEPALRRTTRDLMGLHDELLERESAFVYAPCLHQKGCPMLRLNQRDWCHTYIPWVRPPWIERIDRLVGIQKNYLICSYLFLGKERPSQKEQKIPLWRVVSGPLNSKGKSERLLCGDDSHPEIFRVMRLDRDESPQNRGFDYLQRGDLVLLPKTPRIFKETRITKT